MMLLTTEQQRGLVSEAMELVDSSNNGIDGLWVMRNFIYIHYSGHLTVKDHAWYISFEEPKWKTLFLMKHP